MTPTRSAASWPSRRHPAPGVAKVVVFVTDKAPTPRSQSTTFYIMPDGKHALAEGAGVVPFGADPFIDLRTLLRPRRRRDPRSRRQRPRAGGVRRPAVPALQRGTDHHGPARKDFPNAHIVFQLFPLTEIHPSAFKAAAYGVCVQKQSNDAFFKYAPAVFDTQEALIPRHRRHRPQSRRHPRRARRRNIAACAATHATKDAVNADIKLGGRCRRRPDAAALRQRPHAPDHAASLTSRSSRSSRTRRRWTTFSTGAAPDICRPHACATPA